MQGLTSATIASGGLTVNTDTNTITIGQNLTGGGALTKTGAGTLVLKSQSYTGNTVVNAGTLKSQGLVTTTLAGNLIVNAGATLAPGESIGKLLASGNVTLGGTNNQEIARQSLFVSDSDAVQAGGSIALGGTLNVTFDATHVAALSVGSSFTLFQAVGGLSGNFATVNLPTVDPVNGTNITWINTLSTDGKITVATLGTPPVTTPSPTNITYTVSSGQLILNWPNGQGWLLQGQTNPLTLGLGTNWMYLGNTSPYTNTFVAPSVFYRLIYTNAP
jgi:autotransporter-associated beta strand protein